MRLLSSLIVCALLAGRAAAEPAIEAGWSYFNFNNAKYESTANVVRSDESTKGALFVGGSFTFTQSVGFRVSYHYIKGIDATAELSTAPGSPTPVTVFGHYHDDVHLVTAGPEFKWHLNPTFTVSLTPQLNYVSSNGDVSYSTTSATVLLPAPFELDHSGVTLGASARIAWTMTRNIDLTLGYQYTDLNPSFDRVAHIVSVGALYKF